MTQLAKAHAVVSGRYDQAATTLSQAHSGTRSFSISVGGETYDISVNISAGESNATVLANIASAINEAADGEVAASYVMDTPSTGKISIRSGSTGTAGSMTFTDTDGLLSALGVTNQTEATDTVGGYIYADLGGNELDAKLTVDGIQGTTRVDFIIRVGGKAFAVVMFGPGSLVTRERSALATARLIEEYAVPFAVVSNGKDAEVLETKSGRVIAEGLEGIPSKEEALRKIPGLTFEKLPAERLEKERRILYAFDVLAERECDEFTCGLY